MTFSVLGVCRRTGKIGFAQSTSTPGVGWRCTDVVPGVAVVTVQATGDYRKLQFAKKALEEGAEPATVIDKLKEIDEFFEHRQIAVLSLDGKRAVHTGLKAGPWAGEAIGYEHIATGNVLVGEGVVKAMSDRFSRDSTEELEDRLIGALVAGRDAGGQPDGQTSAAITVYSTHAFPIINLRVDVSAEPVNELCFIYEWFKPLVQHYVDRTLSPESVGYYKEFLQERNLKINPYLADCVTSAQSWPALPK